MSDTLVGGICLRPLDGDTTGHAQGRLELLKALRFYILRSDYDNAVYCAMDTCALMAVRVSFDRLAAALAKELRGLFWFNVDTRQLPYMYQRHELAMNLLKPKYVSLAIAPKTAMVVLAPYVTGLACAPKSSLVDDLFSVFDLGSRYHELPRDGSVVEEGYVAKRLREIFHSLAPGLVDLVSSYAHVHDASHEDANPDVVSAVTPVIENLRGVPHFPLGEQNADKLTNLYYALKKKSLRAVYWALECVKHVDGVNPNGGVIDMTSLKGENFRIVWLLQSLQEYARVHLDQCRVQMLQLLERDVTQTMYARLDNRRVAICGVLMCIREVFEENRSTTRESSSHMSLRDPYWWTDEDLKALMHEKRSLELYKNAAKNRDLHARFVLLNDLSHVVQSPSEEYAEIKLAMWVLDNRDKRNPAPKRRRSDGDAQE